MIKSFQDAATTDIYSGKNTKAARKIPQELHRKTKLLLDLLNAAVDVAVMATPPGNRLHKLSGDLDGFWSVSINDQWRIIFRFDDGNAHDVLILDYH
jgi:proteic killer suppression protein